MTFGMNFWWSISVLQYFLRTLYILLVKKPPSFLIAFIRCLTFECTVSSESIFLSLVSQVLIFLMFMLSIYVHDKIGWHKKGFAILEMKIQGGKSKYSQRKIDYFQSPLLFRGWPCKKTILLIYGRVDRRLTRWDFGRFLTHTLPFWRAKTNSSSLDEEKRIATPSSHRFAWKCM